MVCHINYCKFVCVRVRFYIEKRKDPQGNLLTARRPVIMTVAFHGRRVSISTGVTVDLEMWDQNLQRVKGDAPDSVGLNAWLDALSETAGVTWKALAGLSEKPGVAEFREAFEQRKPRFSAGFFTVFYQFMEEGKDRWSMATYRKVRTIYNHLREFEGESDRPLGFHRMDSAFLESFTSFYRRKGNNPLTTRKAVNILVWFLNWATENGYNVFYAYRKFYRNLEPAETTGQATLYLDWDELMRLFHLRVHTPRMRRARDIFCLMCFTGVRFSELDTLTRNDLGEDHIRIRRNNRTRRTVPLNRFSRYILDSYRNRYYRNNRAMPEMSLVTLNKYLKALGKEAEIKAPLQRPVSRKTPNGGIPKYELLTAGVAPNTFIMNALQLDIPAEIISAYTGVADDIRVKTLKEEMARREMKKFDRLPGENQQP